MKKLSLIMIVIAAAVFAIIVLSSSVSGVAVKQCGTCHTGWGAYLALDVLEGDSRNQLPSAIGVAETKTVTVALRSLTSDVHNNTILSNVNVTLTSQNGRFSVSNPTYFIGTLQPNADATATWQITGTSAGSDVLVITARAIGLHKNLQFVDTYAPNPTITVGSSPPQSTLTLNINPQTVARGATLTISGQLTPGKATTIELYYRYPQTTGSWKVATTMPTNSLGAYSKTVTVPNLPTGVYDLVAAWFDPAKGAYVVSSIKLLTIT